MNTVSLNILDSYAAMTAEQKGAVLSNILLDELHREDDFKVRLKELLTTEQDDALLSRIIGMLGGGCLADSDFRDKLGSIADRYAKNSLSYNSVRELMITALFVGSKDLKSWGESQLDKTEKIDTKNETKLVNYLRDILDDVNLPVRLRWHAGLGLANHGTEYAVNKLISSAQNLSERLPKEQTDNYYDDENLFLAEKIAYWIGFAADKIQSLSELDKAYDFLMKLNHIIEDSLQIQSAIERIKNVGISPRAYPLTAKPSQGNHRGLPLQEIIAIPNIVKWISDLWIPEGAGQLLSAADISPQEKFFLDGTVKIICIFKGEYDNNPAYIWLSWDALKTPENSELIIQLLNPDTKEVLFECCLGNIKEGEESFSADELKFDPTKTKWAINVGLRTRK